MSLRDILKNIFVYDETSMFNDEVRDGGFVFVGYAPNITLQMINVIIEKSQQFGYKIVTLEIYPKSPNRVSLRILGERQLKLKEIEK